LRKPIAIGETTMKKLITLLLIAGLQACSTISKETYTETRTLTYPKGGEPHLKEMYLKDGKHQEQNTYIGTNDPQPVHQPVVQPVHQPEPYVNDVDLIAPVPEVNNYQASYTPPEREKTLDQLIHENLMLQAKQRNAWLRSQM
jgi:hypothetical protein